MLELDWTRLAHQGLENRALDKHCTDLYTRPFRTKRRPNIQLKRPVITCITEVKEYGMSEFNHHLEIHWDPG